MTIADIDKLPSLPITEKSRLPNTPAVYFVVNADRTVLYIGQSQSLKKRWTDTHHRYTELSAMTGVRIAWMVIGDTTDRKAAEQAGIKQFSPALNKRRDDPAEKKRNMVGFYANDEMAEIIHAIAKDEGLPIAEWLRRLAERELEESNAH